MSLEKIVDSFRSFLDKIIPVDWLSTLIATLCILIVTAIVSAFVTKLIRHLLRLSKNPLPSSSIFVNIGRFIVWAVGICVILSSCFGVNINAVMTALGVGGIAISLGFQGTLTNLIGGLQISLGNIVEPGDYITVNNSTGEVKDVSWRQTTIITPEGHEILIPNSVINSAALTKLPKQYDIRMDIEISKKQDMTEDQLADAITKAVDDAISAVTILKSNAKIEFYGIQDDGYDAMIYFSTAISMEKEKIEDVAIKAMGENAHVIEHEHQPESTIELLPSLKHDDVPNKGNKTDKDAEKK